MATTDGWRVFKTLTTIDGWEIAIRERGVDIYYVLLKLKDARL